MLFRSGINTEIGWDGSKYYGVDFEGEMAFQADWLDTGMLDYTEIGENVRTNSYYVGAFKNTGDVRTADLFAIPRSVVSGELNWDLGNMISNSGKLKPEYAKYLLGGVTQKAGEEETVGGLSFKYGDMANNSGASLKKSTNSDLINFYMSEWGVSADNVYELTYDNPNSGTMAHISWDVEASEPFFEIAEENSWLKANLGYDYFTISMRPENPAPSDFFEGGVVMVVDGKPVNAIHCILLNNTADE